MKVGVGLKPATTVLELKELLGTSLRTIYKYFFFSRLVAKIYTNIDKVNIFLANWYDF
jgi:hypothetical protein